LSPGERPRVTNPSASHVLDEVSGVVKYFLATDEGARQFQDARKLFEGGIARRAARQATSEQIEDLLRVLEANQRRRRGTYRQLSNSLVAALGARTNSVTATVYPHRAHFSPHP
jgi:DNA-binding FadR family transcriptional regulator